MLLVEVLSGLGVSHKNASHERLSRLHYYVSAPSRWSRRDSESSSSHESVRAVSVDGGFLLFSRYKRKNTGRDMLVLTFTSDISSSLIASSSHVYEILRREFTFWSKRFLTWNMFVVERLQKCRAPKQIAHPGRRTTQIAIIDCYVGQRAPNNSNPRRCLITPTVALLAGCQMYVPFLWPPSF